MASDNHDNLLREAVADAANSFAPNELAYLALTSKPEHHFRDRMAFGLYKRLKNVPVIVRREWNHVDLALLAARDETPSVLLELKWMWSMDAWAGRSDYHRCVLDDEAKALRLASSCTSVYTLMLATHPRAEIPSQYWPAMPYASNNAIRIQVQPISSTCRVG